MTDHGLAVQWKVFQAKISWKAYEQIFKSVLLYRRQNMNNNYISELFFRFVSNESKTADRQTETAHEKPRDTFQEGRWTSPGLEWTPPSNRKRSSGHDMSWDLVHFLSDSRAVQVSWFKGCFLSQEIVSCSRVYCHKAHSPGGSCFGSMNHRLASQTQAHDLFMPCHSRNDKHMSHTWFLGWVFNWGGAVNP